MVIPDKTPCDADPEYEGWLQAYYQEYYER